MTISTDILNNYKHIFAGDPIIVRAQTSNADAPASAVLAQLVVRVLVHLPNEITHTHDIAQQFMPGDTVFADISSALQTEYQLMDRTNEPSADVLDNLEPGVTSTESYYPFSFSLQAFVRYLQNGTEYSGEDNPVTVIENVHVLRGHLLPNLRRIINSPSAAVAEFAPLLTTKPHIPVDVIFPAPAAPVLLETVNAGDPYAYSVFDTEPTPTVTSSYMIADADSDAPYPQIVPDEGLPSVLVIDPSPDRQLLVFRNSMGVLETFSAITLKKTLVNRTSERLASVLSPSYSQKENVLNSSVFPNQTIEMSTGFLPKEWADWFVGEVLTAEYVWMPMKTRHPKTGTESFLFVPVYLEVDNELVMEDLKTTSIPEIQFKVKIKQKL